MNDVVLDLDSLGFGELCEDKTLILPKDCVGTRQCGEKILNFIQKLREDIDYDELRDDKLLFDAEYAKRNELHDQLYIWEINRDDMENRGKVYRFLKKAYLKLCPNRLRPYVKKVYKFLTGQL